MERKSIGGFIAALRRERGLTQKELAEQLNVSDKTVSRWERDEGTPDLYLVPVLADIFGVSCDELLRGERAAGQGSASAPPAAERPNERPDERKEERPHQRQTLLLKAGLTKYENRTLISCGIILLGLIAACIANLAFNRAYIGFFAAAAGVVAALICQSVFANNALLVVAAENAAGAAADAYWQRVRRLRYAVWGLAVLLLAFCLPLVVLVQDAYWGLTLASWLVFGLRFMGLALLPLLIVVVALEEWQVLRRGGEAAQRLVARRAANRPLRRRCLRLLAALLLVTFIAHAGLTQGFSTRRLAQGTVFDDYDSFRRYMSVDVPSYLFEPHVAPLDSAVERVEQEFDSATGEPYRVYYDAEGNIISEDQALTRQIKNRAGEVLCEYVHRNSSVVRISYGSGEDMLPITTYTQGDLYHAQQRLQTCNLIFIGIYLAEIATIAIYFALKRVR